MSQECQTLDSERGFTLVELMVVVAIIALLAAIIIPNYVHSRASAAVAQSEANMKQIATALELYYTDNQQYPASGTVTPALFTGGKAGKGGTVGGNPYLNATPYNALTRTVQVYAYRRKRFDDADVHDRRSGHLRLLNDDEHPNGGWPGVHGMHAAPLLAAIRHLRILTLS